jgi:Kef-type K+ transport system membrane component KefB
MLTLAEADAVGNLVHQLRHVSVEDVLLPVLVQLAVIIVAARLFAVLFRRLGQPGVVGEIVAGLVLGPSLLGRYFPEISRVIFHPVVGELPPLLFDAVNGWFLTVLSQVGLVFLLFLIGLEFDFSHLRWHGRSALGISIAGIALPFMLGVGIAQLMLPYLATSIPPLGFTLFLGTALSITAIPVLGRIMMELNITRTRLGAITIAAAAVDDAAGWILLATVTAVVQSNLDGSRIAIMIGETLLFSLAMVFVARPLLGRWARAALRRGDGELGLNDLAVVLAVLFGCAVITNRIGIFAVFGAFLFGAVLSSEHDFRAAVNRRLRDFVFAFFVPVFFTYTGLRTDISALTSATLWLLAGLTLAAAIVGKLGGCGLAAWLSGYSPRESACIGALMSTRGLMALVVVNLGKDLGVIPDSVFCMLVIMALLTTAMTTPALLWWMKGTELEACIRASGFLEGSRGHAPPEASEARTSHR